MNTTKAIIILVVFIGILFLGRNYFSNTASVPFEMDETVETVSIPSVEVAVGQTIESNGLSIRLNEVSQDLRCPVDIECQNAGAINTNITISANGAEETILYASNSDPLVFQNYEISIVGVSPELISSETISGEDYVVSFNITNDTTDVSMTDDSQEVFPIETPENLCIATGGEWSMEFQECLGISGEVCLAIGGNWNECASACRNNPEAEICTMQCVQVCDFKNEVFIQVQ